MQDDQQIDPDLDELLDAATWLEAGPDRFGRLERQWDMLRRRQRVVVSSAIAASLFLPLAAAIGLFVLRNPTEPIDHRDSVQAVPDLPVSEDMVRGGQDRKVDQSQPKESHRGREANTYERTMLLLHSTYIVRNRRAEKVVTEDPLAVAVAAIVTRPGEDIAETARRLAEVCPNGEARLRALVQAPPSSERAAAIRLLSTLGTRQSLVVLLWCSRQQEQPAAEAVARLSTAAELAALARAESDLKLSRRWMAALAERGSPDAARRFLALVEDPIYSATALSACRFAKRPAVDTWFAALRSRRVATRMAAARALGALNDPEVSTRLARLAIDGTAGPEAFAGLLTSTDEVAEEFRRFARDDMRLWPTLRAIDSRLRRDDALN